MSKLTDWFLGRPKAHQPKAGPNRKQKRVQLALKQKRLSAAQRRKHEKRG